MLLAFSAQKGPSNPESFMRLGGGREENPRASLESSIKRDRKELESSTKTLPQMLLYLFLLFLLLRLWPQILLSLR
jgi:hypothetical protein